MKSYGGFLPIELYNGDEYYKSHNMIRVNSARSGVVLATQIEECSNIYIPAYLCDSVKKHLLKHNIHTECYNIDENLLPIVSEKQFQEILQKKAIILITNFFGIIDDDTIQSLVERYKNVIVDNTQAFFNNPRPNTYTVYSCRKFIGVSDGAYLIGEKCLEKYEENLPESYSGEGSKFLLKSFELGTDESYEDFLLYEEEITRQGVLRMSQLTQGILKNVDYESIKKRRKENFDFLATKLIGINEISISDSINYPMVYPLLLKNEMLRESLIKNRVYVPQWWKCCIENSLTNRYEKYLSKYLIPLPIDQRYDVNDMEFIVKCVFSSIK